MLAQATVVAPLVSGDVQAAGAGGFQALLANHRETIGP
jgi:hypothetical protein